jgi:hypothetical protein
MVRTSTSLNWRAGSVSDRSDDRSDDRSEDRSDDLSTNRDNTIGALSTAK